MAGQRSGPPRRKTVPESKIVETLIGEAMKIAEQTEKDGVASGEP